MRAGDNSHQRGLAASEGALEVALEQRGKRLLVLPLRVLRRKRLHAVKGKQELEIQRLLGPECAVVVEHGDALGRRHEIGRALLGNFRHEVHDGLFGLAVVPGWERVGGACDGMDERQPANERGDEQAAGPNGIHGCVPSKVSLV